MQSWSFRLVQQRQARDRPNSVRTPKLGKTAKSDSARRADSCHRVEHWGNSIADITSFRAADSSPSQMWRQQALAGRGRVPLPVLTDEERFLMNRDDD